MGVTKLVSINIDEAIFNDLKDMAEPLVDDINTVLTRLIRHWKSNPASKSGGVATGYWVSARGEQLPIGLKLRARYMGDTVEAKVSDSGIVYNGKPYPSPSRAAIAAKTVLGAKGSAANQNGWDFWEYYDVESKTWRFLRAYR